jgi:N-methylhydantoinase A
MRLDAFEPETASALLDEMSREARSLAEAAAGGRKLEEERLAYMRYTGQGHEIAVPLPPRTLNQKDIGELRERFESGYRTLFERHIPGARIEILSWSVLVSTETDTPKSLSAARASAAPKPSGAREVWDPAEGRMLSVATYARASMKPGARIPGPALILEAGTSTLVTATFDASTDAGGALVLERKKSTRRGKA